MTTNNISQKQILSYLVQTFSYFGISYISQQHLKQCKKNKPDYLYLIKQLLFHLSILHMFDYDIKINQYFQFKQKIKQTQLDQLILAYLSQTKCQYLIEIQNIRDEEDRKRNKKINGNKCDDDEENRIVKYVGCDLSSSRQILLLCGWVMAISNYFTQILNKIIRNKQRIINNPLKKLPKCLQNLQQNSELSGNLTQLNENQKVIQYYKSIQTRQYNITCLKQKKQKIIKRIQTQLKKFSPNLTIYDLFNTKQAQQQALLIKQQKQLHSILVNQIQNLKQRKYFWIWLDQKILKQTQNDLQKNNQSYQKLQYNKFNKNNDLNDFSIDLNYLQKYMQLCSYYQEKYNQLAQKLDNMKLVIKKYKQIQNQVSFEVNQTLNSRKYQHKKKHLFIALQLKNYMQIKQVNASEKLEKNNLNNQEQQSNQIKTKQIKKKLKKSLKNYLNSIEQAVKFI